MLENLKKYYLKYIASLLIGVGILCINNIIQNNWTNILAYVDGAFIAGMTLICVGGLSVCSYYGAYDVFAYMFVKKYPNGTKPSLYEFSEDRKENRKKIKGKFIPYFLFGGVFLCLALILYIFI